MSKLLDVSKAGERENGNVEACIGEKRKESQVREYMCMNETEAGGKVKMRGVEVLKMGR